LLYTVAGAAVDSVLSLPHFPFNLLSKLLFCSRHLDSARTIIGEKMFVNISHNIKKDYFELDFLKDLISPR